MGRKARSSKVELCVSTQLMAQTGIWHEVAEAAYMHSLAYLITHAT